MVEVVVHEWNVTKVLEVVAEMRRSGFQQHKDFDFEYHPPVFDSFTQPEEKYTVFRFYDDKLASWFSLKWF